MTASPMRSQIARLGGLAKSAKYEATAATEPARRAFNDRFIREADPDGVLPLEERLRRADALKKLHFAQMAFRSAQTRRKKTQRANGEAAASNVLPIRKASR